MCDIENARTNFSRFRQLQKHAGVSSFQLLHPGILGLLSTVAEGLSLALLLPITRGIIEGNFDFLKQSRLHPYFEAITPAKIFADPLYFGLTLGVFAVILRLLEIGLRYLSQIYGKRQSLRFASSLKQLVYESYLSFGKGYFDTRSTGYLQQVINHHTNSIFQFLTFLQMRWISICQLVVYMLVLFSLSWHLACVVLVVFPLLHMAITPIITTIRMRSKAAAEVANADGTHIQNTLSNIRLVKAYQTEKSERDRFQELCEKEEKLKYDLEVKRAMVSPIDKIITLGLFVVLMTIIVVIHERVHSETLAEYMVFLVVLRRCSTLLNLFGLIKVQLASFSGSMAEVIEVFNENEKFRIPSGSQTFTGVNQSIDFKDFSFKYQKGPQIFDKLSLTISSKKRTALVGASGSGKTTLINILMRLYDVEPGSVFVDGKDIRSFSVESWRSKIALVEQEPLLFHGTFRENLLYGVRSKLSDKELTDTLERFQLLDLTSGMEQGLDTLVGERGIMLSGGERQRLSIARAFLRNAEIIFLDEPTSSLDSVTENTVMSALDILCEERTVITIAHRLATIQNADHIIVFSEGKVVEQGSFEQLLGNDSTFHKLWTHQRIG
jgi:ABC-type multidrug transport system fused ATPase/permease subunit